MKKLFAILSLVVLSITIINAKTLKDAETDNIKKPIYVLVTQNNCTFCVKQKRVLKDPEMAKFIKDNFQYVEINRDRVPLSKKVYSPYSPTTFILTENGDVVDYFPGYIKSRQLKENLKASIAEVNALKRVEKDLR